MLPSARSASWCRQRRETAKYLSFPRFPTAQSPWPRTVPGGSSAAGTRAGSDTGALLGAAGIGVLALPTGRSGNSGGRLLVRRVRTSLEDVPRIGGLSVRRLPVVLGLSAVLLLAAGGPALADPPFGVSGSVTDQAGVLQGNDKAEIEQAIDDLRKNEGISEYVVFVSSFDGVNGEQWARQTAEQSGLGANDFLLAVAIGERHYG